MPKIQETSSDRGWFRIYRVVVDVYGKELGAYGLAVYAYLACRADNDTQTCFLLVGTIATALDISEAKVRRELKKLERLELVVTTRRLGRSSTYFLSTPVLDTAPPRYDVPDTPVPDTESSGTTYRHNKNLFEQDSFIKKRRKRRTQFPEVFTVTEAHRALAKELGLDVDAEVSKFKDNHVAKGSAMADWDAAFSYWLRNANAFAQPSRHLSAKDRQRTNAADEWERKSGIPAGRPVWA